MFSNLFQMMIKTTNLTSFKTIAIASVGAMVFGFTSCSSEAKESSEDSKNPEKSTETTKNGDDTLKVEPVTSMVDRPTIDIDPYLNDVALVISGLPIEGSDSTLKAIQATDYYKAYQKFTEETFAKVKKDMLEPVAKWTAENNVRDGRKNVTCFYPFSGPDFMFANAFYPQAQNYVLLGLERRGSTPNFKKMSENDRKNYFAGLKKSMKYINTRGYFVTSHMGSDYSKTHLNGITHMALYMMMQTNHKIVKVEDGWLSKDGKLTRIDEHAKSPDGAVRLKCIDFTDANQKDLKTLYFFNHNIQDDKVTEHMEMVKFIESFPNRAAYLKAAQCAAFNPDFKVVRDLVTGSGTIIQDDSGIPYKLLKDTTKFDTKLYGTYTTVISDLSWCLQRDLKKDVVEKGNNADLPFKISYNGNYGKGVIIFAKKK